MRSSPEASCVIEFLGALEAGEAKRLEELVAVYQILSRGEKYAPSFDPAAFGGSAEAKSRYLRAWAERSLDALRKAGVKEPSAARVVGTRDAKDPKGTEVLLEYEAPSGRLRLGAVVVQFTRPRLAFIAREGWRGARKQRGAVQSLLSAPVNVYLADPGLMGLMRGRIPPGQYAGVEVARGLPEDVAGEFVLINARGVFVAGEPVGREAFAEAVALVRGGAKAMVVFGDGAVGWPVLQEVFQGLARAGYEEVAFVARAKRPPGARRGGHDCLGVVRCVPGARVESPDVSLVPVVGRDRWIIAEEDGTPRTPPVLPSFPRFRALLESAARGSGARIHMPPHATLGTLLQVLQYFGEDPSKAELSGPLQLKRPEEPDGGAPAPPRRTENQ